MDIYAAAAAAASKIYLYIFAYMFVCICGGGGGCVENIFIYICLYVCMYIPRLEDDNGDEQTRYLKRREKTVQLFSILTNTSKG